jgi:DMSO/TMAO reductase YedYZ molybdopterin-dependent catalytic subunit
MKHHDTPLVTETPLAELPIDEPTPASIHFIRNHFETPGVDVESWRLELSGLFQRPTSLTLDELRGMPSQSMPVTLECAGNGRSQLVPEVEGEAWGYGAVGTAVWSGVPLAHLIDRAVPQESARQIRFRGADGGPGRVHYERSLTVEQASGTDALVAYLMNGEDLPAEHGRPVRLIVPRWYGMASVKWLTQITAKADDFSGHFQQDRYWYEWPSRPREPVTLQNVRAVITKPRAGEEVPRGDATLRGLAWSGFGRVSRVEIAVGDGPWRDADLARPTGPYGWQRFGLGIVVERPGRLLLRARATDEAGRTQPDVPPWNRLGYGANAVEQVWVTVR